MIDPRVFQAILELQQKKMNQRVSSHLEFNLRFQPVVILPKKNDGGIPFAFH